MTPIYSSDIAVSGAGLKPDGVPWVAAPTRCACCGKPVLTGDLAVRDKDRMGKQFTDGPSLAARGSGAVCGSCCALMNAVPLMALQNVVVTRDAAYPIRRDAHRAWFLLTPPKPPYVAVVNDTKQSHLIWRTPPTLDNDLVIVRLGARLMRIRRPVLMQAVADCQLTADAYNELAGTLNGSRRIEGLRHAFLSLSRDMDNPLQGILRPLLAMSEAAKSGPAAEAIRRLQSLSPGELWALATLAKRTVETPEKPDPIDLSARAAAAP